MQILLSIVSSELLQYSLFSLLLFEHPLIPLTAVNEGSILIIISIPTIMVNISSSDLNRVAMKMFTYLIGNDLNILYH